MEAGGNGGRGHDMKYYCFLEYSLDRTTRVEHAQPQLLVVNNLIRFVKTRCSNVVLQPNLLFTPVRTVLFTVGERQGLSLKHCTSSHSFYVLVKNSVGKFSHPMNISNTHWISKNFRTTFSTVRLLVN